MRIGTKVQHTRRNGAVFTGKVTSIRDSSRGKWMVLKGEIGGKETMLQVRPSQVKAV